MLADRMQGSINMTPPKTIGILVCICLVGACEEPAKAPVAAAEKLEPAAEATAGDAPTVPPASEAPAVAPGLAIKGAQAELGQPAPDFTLSDLEGHSVKLSTLRGKTVVLEWFNPDCPFIKYAHGKGPLARMARNRVGDTLAWLSINSGGEGKQGYGLSRNREGAKQFGIENPILFDPKGEVGHAYGAEKTPHMFVIDARGTLVYRGALDNAPIGEVDPARPRYDNSKDGALVNYVDGALADLAAGKPLRLAETPPYGCSVKYAK